MAQPGDTLRTFARVVHTDQSPHTGLQLIPDLIAGPAGVLDPARFTFSELPDGSGFYEVQLATYVTDPYGDYEIHFHANNGVDGGIENSNFTHNWTLVERTPTAPGLAGAMGTPRLEIRQVVARMLSDYWTATAYASGDTNALTDPINLAQEANFFKGMQIHFTNPDSPNYGRIASVVASDAPTRTIYFEPPLPGPVVAGDTIDMYNFRGRGTTIRAYNDAINAAIRIARDNHFRVPVSVTLEAPFNQRSPYLTIPADFTDFRSLEVTRSDGYLYRVLPRDIQVDPFSRRIEVSSRFTSGRIHGQYVTLNGLMQPALLFSDEDRTTVDLEWLLNEVKAQVLQQLILLGVPIGAQDRIFAQERTEANGKRAIVMTQALPNTIRLY